PAAPAGMLRVSRRQEGRPAAGRVRCERNARATDLSGIDQAATGPRRERGDRVCEEERITFRTNKPSQAMPRFKIAAFHLGNSNLYDDCSFVNDGVLTCHALDVD